MRMGLLDMSRQENDLHMRFMTEAAKLRGQPCQLYQVDSSESDLHNDKNIVYKAPVLINILFEEHPKTILKKMNWFSEDEELPYVAYLTNLDKNYVPVRVTKDCLIVTRSSPIDEFEYTRFLISSVRGSQINPVFWICKLVPYRPKANIPEIIDPEAPNNTDMGYSFIKRS